MRLRSIFRQFFFWGIPLVFTLVLVVLGFVYWLVATPTGTRWAMNTAALQFEGQSRGVKGSLWSGLEFEGLSLLLPDDMRVEVDGAKLEVDWPQLWQSRELRIKELSARRVAVWMDGEPKPDDPDAEPFVMPELPVTVRIDRLALGELHFSQQGEPLPVDLSQLQLRAASYLDQNGLQLGLESARVGYNEMWLETDGTAKLTQFAAPWNSLVQLGARVSSDQADSPLCLDQYLPDHLKTPSGTELRDPNAPLCAVNANANWEGSLENAVLTVVAAGQGVDVDVSSNLQLTQSFPVRDSTVSLALPDGSTVDAQLDWQRHAEDPSLDSVSGSIQAQNFNVGAWLPEKDLPATVTLSGDYSAQLSQFTSQLDQASLNFVIGETSRWNKQPLSGHAMVDVSRLAVSTVPEIWQAYTIKNSDIDLRVGSNHLLAKGAFGVAESVLKLGVDAPALQQLWPGLDQIGATSLDAELRGSVFEHQLKAKAKHVLKGADPKAKVGNGPVDIDVAVQGVWDMNSATPSWRGQIQQIQADHAGLGVSIKQPFTAEVLLPAAEQEFAAKVGAFSIQALVDKEPLIKLQHDHTTVDQTGFSTKGQTEAVSISVKRIDELMHRLGLEKEKKKRGGVVDKRENLTVLEDLSLQLAWDVALKEALSGTIKLQRLAGDILVPAEPSFPLGLKHSEVVLTIVPGAGGRSMLNADVDIQTEKMGYIKAKGTSPIYYSKANGFEIRTADRKELVVNAHMDNLTWTNLILRDQLELGGELVANVTVQSTADGSFTTQGDITGDNLRITRLDDGVRLLNGNLKANLNNNRFTVERLYFPAQLRVEPKEWRTATWIREADDAQNGSLLLQGYWDLETNIGDFNVKLHRYPLLQRADRYAMVSGDLNMKAELPQINLSGKITADAGWFNLDMLGGLPSVDGDIVVIRSTDPVIEDEPEGDGPMNMTMSLEVDLGPRFYLTGYGVNSGLVGQLNLQMHDGQLTALGALNTRGGAIEMYGQRLQLRRGTVTFQGDIGSPILDIQALRTGLSVEAGVKVGGTARKPRIDLISVPEVSELEKLSWLLFGHGPDDSGGDLALLLSVGTSFLGDGEPFYRKFGIDELAMRSGELGGAGSILPASSTASSLESEISDVERRFIEASKRLTSDLTVSVRQALSDTGTVGRMSYKLTRRLTAELSVGTVNGLALIYRWISKD